MVLFRRYKTVAEKDQFLIVSMTFFSLLNSAFIIVVIRHHFTGPWLASLVSDLFSLRNY